MDKRKFRTVDLTDKVGRASNLPVPFRAVKPFSSSVSGCLEPLDPAVKREL